MALPGSRTNPDLVAARFLLKPGRQYEEAVKAFEPYDRVKEENPEARAAGRALIAEGKTAGPKAADFRFREQSVRGERDFFYCCDDGASARPVANVLREAHAKCVKMTHRQVGDIGESSGVVEYLQWHCQCYRAIRAFDIPCNRALLAPDKAVAEG